MTFPLCWRCTSLAVTVLVMQAVLGATLPLHWAFGVLGVILIALGVFDGYRSYCTVAGTTNRNRAVFGALLGGGLFLTTLAVKTQLEAV